MSRRRRSLIGRFLRAHSIVVVAMLVGAGAGYGADRWLSITDRTQLYVSAAVATLVLIGRLVLGIGYGAVYIIEVAHPDTGRPVCGYVGKTTQYPPSKRIAQHLEGSARYGTPAQPWEDTVLRWWLAHESRWMTNLGLHLRELVNIRMRRPLYNYTMNLGNRRRIPKWTAEEQRAERDRAWWVA